MPVKEYVGVTHPELAAQLKDQSLATTLTAGSDKKPVWVCDTGHEWEAMVYSRRDGRGCPFCSGNKVLPGFNDLATANPGLAATLKDPSMATTLTAGSGKKVVWVCAEGHEWEASVDHRKKGRGCPFCSGHRVLPGFNDLATTNPAIAAQLKDQSLATSLSAGTEKKTIWLCAEGHEWEAMVSNRTKGSGCSVCAGQRVLPGFNDISTTHPGLAAELKDQSLATSLSAGSNKKVSWVCAESHEWGVTVNDRTNGDGCPFCSGRLAIPGETDLATTHPELAAELKDQSLATSLSAGSDKKPVWVCAEGHEWHATVSSRTNGNGCSSCALYGFDITQPAFVYLVSQKRLHAEDTVIVKIGIANTGSLDTRLAKHARQGLTEVLRTREYPLGSQAKKKEDEFKRYLEKLPTQFRVTKDELPDGYTEAFLSTSPDWEERADLVFC